MKFIVEISEPTTPETMRQIIRATLEGELAVPVDVETQVEEPHIEDRLLSLNNILRVDGKSFRCTCGSNVFSKRKDERGIYYECHGCYAVYRGEPDDAAE